MTRYAIRAEGLRRQFGDTNTVDGVDLTVEGIVYGFLGPNGAGKTTTIRMLATLIRPTGGWARELLTAFSLDDAADRRARNH